MAIGVGTHLGRYEIRSKIGEGGMENHHVNFSVGRHCSKKCSKYLHSLKAKEEHEKF